MNPFYQLKKAYPRRYPKWKTCYDNAKKQYEHEGLSLYDRKDIERLRTFIKPYVGNIVLDVGCGPLPLPGYLKFQKDRTFIYGVDIENNQAFGGLFRCAPAEFLPLPDRMMNLVIFGTSLDHTIDPAKAMSEARRVLVSHGRIIVFMMHYPIRYRLRKAYCLWRNHRYFPMNDGRYFYVPLGAPDPFHPNYLSVSKVIRLAWQNGLYLCDYHVGGPLEVFLAFSAKRTNSKIYFDLNRELRGIKI